MSEKQTHTTWQYPGFKTLNEAMKSKHRPSHFLWMLLFLKQQIEEVGPDDFTRKQAMWYNEHFIRHEKHFEIITQYFGCPGEMHNLFLSWDALINDIYEISENIHPGDDDYTLAIDQENDAFFKIRQVLEDHKKDRSLVDQIKFIVKDREGFSKTITIGDEALEEILTCLEELPEGKPLNRKRGRRKLTNQNEFYKMIIKVCIEFIDANYHKEFTLTDRLLFAALSLSVVYLDFESPLTYDGSIQDYKDAVSDQLKYYL